MNKFLLLFLLLQVPARNVATVTGTVRGANGEPVAGVRVYAVALRDAAEAEVANVSAPLDGLTATDSSGHFRLEVAAGRYYIAAGSLGAPTYFPGTLNVAEARVMTLTAGGVVEGIDFPSVVIVPPAPANAIPVFYQPIPGSTGILSGEVRYADGSAASGIPITALPISIMVNGIPLLTPRSVPPQRTSSDSKGRYRIENVPPDTYYLVAGYTEALAIYPGGSDLQGARKLTTTPATRLDNLDFVVPPLPPRSTLKGRVTGIAGAAAAGVMVGIQRVQIGNSPLVYVPSATSREPITTGIDGAFEFGGLAPGTYALNLTYTGLPERKIIVISDKVVTADIALPIAVLSGRIFTTDGTPLATPEAFEEVVATLDGAYYQTKTMFSIAANGTFGRYLETGEYRFRLRTLPDEYVVSSITAGGVDLLTQSLKVGVADAVRIDIAVTRRTAVASAAGFSVSGSAVDSISGKPTVASRVVLCCLDQGVSEKLSTPLRPDGTFTFASVPAGSYALGLKTRPSQNDVFFLSSNVEVKEQPLSGLGLVSAAQLAPLSTRVLFEDGSLVPETFPASVVLTGTGGRVRVIAQPGDDGMRHASLPVGDRYAVSVTGLPEGYMVKSVVGATEVQAPNYPAIGAPPPPVPIIITIALPVR